MKATSILAFVILVVSCNGEDALSCPDHDGPGTLAWAVRAGGKSYDYPTSMEVTNEGSAILVGRFKSELTFSGVDEKNVTLKPDANIPYTYDTFIAKYSSNGSLEWAKRAESRAWSVETIEDGSFLLTGEGAVLSMYNSGGELLWSRQAEFSEEGKLGGTLAACPDGSYAFAGGFTGTVTFDKGEPNEASVVANGSDDAFVGRFDSLGKIVWAIRMGGDVSSAIDYARDVACLSDGSSVVVGRYGGELVIGPADGSTPLLDGGQGNKVFIARQSSKGEIMWAQRAGFGGEFSWPDVYAVAAREDDSVVIVGDFIDEAVFGEGEVNETVLYGNSRHTEDVFVASYGPDGSLEWVTKAASDRRDHVSDVSILPDGSAVVVGYFSELPPDSPSDGNLPPFSLGDGENSTELESVGGRDMFIAAYSRDGALIWARREGGSDYSELRDEVIGTVTIDRNGSIMAAGEFLGDITFGPCEESATSLSSAGNGDVFLLKLEP